MAVNKEKVKDLLKEIKPATLVAATKYANVEDLYELEKLGINIFGENIVQSLLEKYESYQGTSKFHMIGTLQTNKVRYIIDKVDMIHSVANYRLIDEIDKQAKKNNLVMKILIQVNIAKEESKHGFEKEELVEVFKYLENKENILAKGLMVMAPNVDAKDTEIYFKEANELLDIFSKTYPNLTELSMGMSNDYKYALKHNATYIRIGSLLFK